MLRTLPVPLLAFALFLHLGTAHAQPTFVEDFTTDTYINTAATNADLDLVAGQVGLYPFAAEAGWSIDGPGNSRNLDIQGSTLYLADGFDGLELFSDNGMVKGSFNTSGYSWDVDAVGDYAYVADGNSGLQIIDCSNLYAPSLVGTYNTPGYAYGITVAGTTAYVSDGANGVVVIDVSIPAAPSYLGTYPMNGNARDVEVVGNRAYVADSGGYVKILDVSVPASPSLLGFASGMGQAYAVDVEGDALYVASYTDGFKVVDISNPSSPTSLASINVATVRDVFVDGDRAYLASNLAGLQIYDVSNPSAPVHVEDFPTTSYSYGVRVSEEFAYLANDAAGIHQVRIGNITPPIARAPVTGIGNTGEMSVQGNTAFIAAYEAGLRVVDISSVTGPSSVGSLWTGGYANDVLVAGDVAYLADTGGGVRVIDVSNPSTPTQIAVYSAATAAAGLALSGNHLFVGNGFNGLYALNVSNPTTPTLLGTAAPVGYLKGMQIVGSLAYVAATYGGLAIYDVSDPAGMFLVGSYITPEPTWDVVVKDDVAYLAGGVGGVYIVDVTNPSAPALLANHPTTGSCSDVEIVGDLLYVAANSERGLVLDVSNPSLPTLSDVFDPGGNVSSVKPFGEYLCVSMGTSGFMLTQRQQSEEDTKRNVVRSFTIDGGSDLIPRARVRGFGAGLFDFSLASDAVATLHSAPSSTEWVDLTPYGSHLTWRAELQWFPGVPATLLDQVRVEWLNQFAHIQSVSDIPNDQGRQVRVEWLRSGHDFVGDPSQIVEYAVYRKVAPGLARNASPVLEGESLLVRGHAAQMASTWDFVASVPVRAEDYYSVVAPTLADSTIVDGQQLSTFMVSALTATPGVYFDSPEVNGYSVDNLAPGTPSGLLAHYQPDAVMLDWDDAPDADFKAFRIYRGTDAGFAVSPSSLVGEVATSAWTDGTSSPWGFFYKVTAVDFSGNESDVASMEAVTGTPERGRGFALHAATPNPFNPSTSIAFEVPVTAHVRLVVYDLAGRRVATLRNERMDPGEYTAEWDGRDRRGAAVASGVYLYRLEAGEFEATRRMTLLK